MKEAVGALSRRVRGAVGYGDGIGDADDVGRFVGQNALKGFLKFYTAVCRWRSTTQ